MKVSAARMTPLPREQLSSSSKAWFDRIESLGGTTGNIHATFARHPKLFDAWMPFATHVMAGSSLPPRDRQLLILRTAWLCGAEYQWGHHARIGRVVGGITDDELLSIIDGPDGAGWSDFESKLLKAADELRMGAHLEDDTWQALSATYSTEQLLDLIFTVGQYHLVSMALNSLGVQLEDGVNGFPR